MPQPQSPVVVIPGITATTLHDHYPLQTRELWSMVLRKEYRRLALHPDDLRYETVEPARVQAGSLFSIYDDFIEALRYELSPKADLPTPVFAFPYDWRRDVRESAVELNELIEEVIDRTKLLRHYAGHDETLKVDLVGHSMGGLIICEYLSQFGKKHRIGKIATLGTPFLGSIEAVVKLATGMGNLSGAKPSERERETARSVPAIYQLLPTYDGAAVDEHDQPVDLLNPANWQRGIVESLSEYVRLHSVKVHKSAKLRSERALEILTSLLDGARRHRETVRKLKLADAGIEPDDWLAVAGIGYPTHLQLTVTGLPAKPRFDISEDQCVDHWNEDNGSRETGDGTVPFDGAQPPFLKDDQLVCVTRDHFSIIEIGDKTVMAFAGLHGVLPMMNLLQRLVVKHFLPTYKGETKGLLPAPGISKDAWRPPIRDLLKT